MEVIEVCQRRLPSRPTTCPAYATKCTRRYVQPARVPSFAPERIYCPPTKKLEAKTTYHLSYLNGDKGRIERVAPCRPRQSLDAAKGKFEDGTTSKLSYQPVWGIVRAKPILPRRSALQARGSMLCTSTARHDYSPKRAEKPEIIIPCGNIRTSSGILDGRTTAGLSYINPGPIRPATSFKPVVEYRHSEEPVAKDTTQKLSYQPFRVTRKEVYPWATKPRYKPPEAAMDAFTTYAKSFVEMPNLPKEQPILPRANIPLRSGDQFHCKTVYNESFLPCEPDIVIPVVPCNNISISNDKMLCDTTNKLSYQPVRTEKRLPILPATKSMIGNGPMQLETTNRRDFVSKSVPRPEVIIPCDNIRSSHDAPLEGHTTTALSYMNPGPILPTPSFKPQAQYLRPTSKIEADTINKLSYQPWRPEPRTILPWQRKPEYEPPKDRMATDTTSHMSYAAPGYYIEECEPDITCESRSGSTIHMDENVKCQI